MVNSRVSTRTRRSLPAMRIGLVGAAQLSGTVQAAARLDTACIDQALALPNDEVIK